MKKTILMLALLVLAGSAVAEMGIGISPDHTVLRIAPMKQRIVAFMVSNGGDSPVQVSLSASEDFIRPEVASLTIPEKKDKDVNFIISPLPEGEYVASVMASASSPSGSGFGLSTKIGASLRIIVGSEYGTSEKQSELSSQEGGCGDGVCQYSEIDNCDADCPRSKEDDSGFNYFLVVIPFLFIVLILVIIKKR